MIKKHTILFFAVITLIALLCFFSVVSQRRTVAYAEPGDYTPVVTVGQKRAYVGQTFSIDVDLSQNQGLLDLYLTLSYDKTAMHLIGVERGNALGSLTYTNTNTQTVLGYSIVPFNMFWDGTSKPDQSNGTIIRLIFESLPTAQAGTYAITMTYDPNNTYKTSTQRTPVEIVNGSVQLVTGDFWAKYYDWNGTELFKKEYRTGDTPAYEGTTPTREADECYSYTFTGWQGIVSDEEAVLKYQAQYKLTPQKYQVFYYVDGINDDSFDGVNTVDDYWKATLVDYGTYMENEAPTKPRYIFSGWYVDADYQKPFELTHMPAKKLSLYGYFVYDIRTTNIPIIQLSSYVEGDEVTVTANMVKNTGFNGMVLTLAHDRSALTLTDVETKDTFSALQFDTTNTKTASGYDVENFKFYYEHTENTYEIGAFLVLKFKIKEQADAGVYDVTFTLGNTDASYINGEKGIRYTEIEVIGTHVPIGKIYKWEKSAEDAAEITIISDSGMPADTTLKVTLVPESIHNIEDDKVTEAAGKNMELKAVYDLKLWRILGDTETLVQPDGTLTVEIKLTQDQMNSKGLKLYSVTEDGDLVPYEFERDGDKIRFGTDHLDRWAIVAEKTVVTGLLSDAATMMITMPILLAIVTMAYALILMGKYKKEKEKEKISV